MKSRFPLEATARCLVVLVSCWLWQACKPEAVPDDGGGFPDAGTFDAGTPDSGGYVGCAPSAAPDAVPTMDGALSATLELDRAGPLRPDGADAATLTLRLQYEGGVRVAPTPEGWDVQGDGAMLTPLAPTPEGYPRARLVATQPGPKVVTVRVTWRGTSFQPSALARFELHVPSPCPGRTTLPVLPYVREAPLAPQQGYAVGDFDGDGAVDVALPEDATASLRLRRNNGKGFFTDGPAISLGSSPRLVAQADLNGDGKPDLVVTTEDLRIRVLLGRGDGTFVAQPSQALPDGAPQALVLDDLDGDGLDDVVVLSVSAFRLSLFRNAGAGALAPPTFAEAPQTLRGVAVVDVDGDGRRDLAGLSSDLFIFQNQGHFTFALAQQVALPEGGTSVAAGDFDGDGDADLAVAIRSDPARVAVLSNGGRGLFDVSLLPIAWPLSAMRAADLDGDGVPELLCTQNGSHNIGVMRWQNGTFSAPEYTLVGDGYFNPSTRPTDLQTGDLDGNGTQDVIAALDGYLLPLRNAGHGKLEEIAHAPLRGLYRDVMADIDGDGVPDAVSVFGDHVVVQYGLLPGLPPRSASFEVLTGQPRELRVVDVDGNGWVDLVIAGWPGQWVYDTPVMVVLNEGGVLRKGFEFRVPDQRSPQLADLDGDGLPELVLAGDSGPVKAYRNVGGGRFAPSEFFCYSRGLDTRGHAVATGDFDGDGRVDLAVGNIEKGRHSLSILRNQGQGAFAEQINIPFPTNLVDFYEDKGLLNAVDVDGNGAPDLLMQNGSGKALFFNPGAPNPRSLVLPDVYIPGLLDVDGDGRADLVTESEAGVFFQSGLGDGTFGPRSEMFPVPASFSARDVTGDGVPDLLVESLVVEVIPGVCRP